MVAALLLLGLQLPDALTLEQAREWARRHRPQLSAAHAVAAEARARLGVAGMVPNPVLQFKHVAGAAAEEAILEQRSDWLFARWPERRAARAGIRSAEADSARLAAELDQDVRVAFYQALAAAETLRLTRALGAAADSLAQFAGERVAAGELSVLEREQFGVEAGRVRQLVQRAEESFQVARAALARALGGGDPPLPTGPLDRGLDQPWPTPPPIETFPLLARALADSARGKALAAAATVRRFPYPTLRIGQEWESEGPFSGAASAILGFAIPIPLWNIGTAPARAAHAQADRAAAAAGEARLEAARLLAAGESRLRAARERALLTRDSLLPRAERLRAGAVRLYRAGQTGVLPLFDALRLEREIALGYLADLLAWQTALADWLALLGRSQ
ncbi:MAG: TolC family protein [Gemmatimonadales bacterium]